MAGLGKEALPAEKRGEALRPAEERFSEALRPLRAIAGEALQQSQPKKGKRFASERLSGGALQPGKPRPEGSASALRNYFQRSASGWLLE